jgi:hypothetical protein
MARFRFGSRDDDSGRFPLAAWRGCREPILALFAALTQKKSHDR